MKTYAYIDGLNLRHSNLQSSAIDWVDLVTMVRQLSPNDDIQKVHYFRSRSKFKPIDSERFALHDPFRPPMIPRSLFSLIWRLSNKHRVADASLARVVIDQEKGTDVNIACHLLNDAARGHMEKAIVISNDSDLAEAIRLSRAFGVEIGIANPSRELTSAELRKVASFEAFFNSELIEACCLPAIVTDKQGREIHRPRAAPWT